jgi:hypothetical protein
MIIAELEQRIVALEVGAQYDVNQDAIEKIEREHLQTLRNIRNALLLEQQSSTINDDTTLLTNNTTTSVLPQTNNVIESLQKENEMLKKKTIKLEYRIQHLVSNMEILYEQSRNSNMQN